jgi:hypothetical protein
MDNHSEESVSATVLEFTSEAFDPTVLMPSQRKVMKAQGMPRAMRAAPRRTSRRSAERRAARSSGSARSLDVFVVLLAGLLLLLPLPSLLDSGNAFVGRLALLLGLIVPPAAILLMLQRRFGPGDKTD